MVSHKGFVDLGYEGAAFMWNHGVSVETRRSAILDRALCDDSWRCLFPSAQVRHLTQSHSDHNPLLPEMEEGGSKRLGARPFKFEAA